MGKSRVYWGCEMQSPLYRQIVSERQAKKQIKQLNNIEQKEVNKALYYTPLTINTYIQYVQKKNNRRTKRTETKE